ncbi:MAG: hypothetical protein O7C75_11020, partial [Verrucomicrobia bacterium]|nr:hypothetical protein [Verrucomicrobiota bacterium]
SGVLSDGFLCDVYSMKPIENIFGKCVQIVGAISKGVDTATLWLTFIALMLWAFLSTQAVIGKQSLWWLLLGPLILIVFGVIREVGWEARHELAKNPVIKLGGNLVSLLRNGFALMAMLHLGQTINKAIEHDSGLTPWQALWKIILGG